MVAVPYRAELGSELRYRAVMILLVDGAAVALLAAAGRLGDLNVGWFDAVWITAVVLLATAGYPLIGELFGDGLREKLASMERLPPDTDRVAPVRRSWTGLVLTALLAGLAVGGVALVVDLEIDGLAIVLAVFVATAIGDRAADLVRVARHERVHRGTVYRVEDPPGTEAGLRWEPG
jgi:hypothetical protein